MDSIRVAQASKWPVTRFETGHLYNEELQVSLEHKLPVVRLDRCNKSVARHWISGWCLLASVCRSGFDIDENFRNQGVSDVAYCDGGICHSLTLIS